MTRVLVTGASGALGPAVVRALADAGFEVTAWIRRAEAAAMFPSGVRVVIESRDDHAVWGTDVYSDDSSVCAAAIHAGAITDQGGKALFDFLPGQPSYEPSNRGGVVSKHWGSWSRSCTAA